MKILKTRRQEILLMGTLVLGVLLLLPMLPWHVAASTSNTYGPWSYTGQISTLSGSNYPYGLNPNDVGQTSVEGSYNILYVSGNQPDQSYITETGGISFLQLAEGWNYGYGFEFDAAQLQSPNGTSIAGWYITSINFHYIMYPNDTSNYRPDACATLFSTTADPSQSENIVGPVMCSVTYNYGGSDALYSYSWVEGNNPVGNEGVTLVNIEITNPDPLDSQSNYQGTDFPNTNYFTFSVTWSAPSTYTGKSFSFSTSAGLIEYFNGWQPSVLSGFVNWNYPGTDSTLSASSPVTLTMPTWTTTTTTTTTTSTCIIIGGTRHCYS